MTLAFPIKNSLSVLFFSMCYFGIAQEKNTIKNQTTQLEVTTADDVSENGHHMVAIGLDYIQPIPTGNNFVGLGMEGKSGFSFNLQLFVYKQIFIGGSVGNSYLTVTNPEITGNYRKSSVRNAYVYAGYEFLQIKKVRLGASIGIGEADYKNEHFTDTPLGNDEAFQFDKGKIYIYKLYAAYEINHIVSVYLDYSYRNDKMRITAPQEIQSLFENAKYHNIGIGLRFYFANHGIFDKVFD